MHLSLMLLTSIINWEQVGFLKNKPNESLLARVIHSRKCMQ